MPSSTRAAKRPKAGGRMWASAPTGVVYYNGLLLLPTEEYTFNEGTGVVTFVNTLGGVGVEQTLTAVIRVYK